MKAFYIDDITANDLNMDDILKGFDRSSSSVGKEYTRKALRSLLFDEDELRKRSERAGFFAENRSEAKKLSEIFKKLGKIKKFSFYNYIFRLKEPEDKKNTVHYILIILLALSVLSIFIYPVIGIFALIAMICINIALYFKQRSQIEGYFLSLKYLISMINCARSILKKTDLKDPSFACLKEDLSSSYKNLASLKRFSWLLTNSVSGSLIDVIMDYVRMIFHVDIIRFNQMRKKALGHEDDINTLYNALGELEFSLNISLYRQKFNVWCEPEFDKGPDICAREVYHPLIKDPVPNSIEAGGSVLFTGSNASGKSTFLKTLAVNQIFAQTIYTCLASEYKSGLCKVLSSMALSDNILGNESYFVVEIKSLKRIFDELGQIPVMCFIDEVLRGTNTKERIAASTQILKKLSESNAIVFAATHDIELTKNLEGYMTNMHFSEEINEKEVFFDYKLKEGAADSCNAIRLLSAYGFDSEMISEALKMCLP